MNDTTPPSPPADAPESGESPPSREFAQALAQHEREGGGASEKSSKELTVGMRVKAKVVSIGDEHLMLDVGGRSEAVAETRHFKDPEGAVKVKAGDELDLYVVTAGDQVTLAPSVKAEGNAALAQVRQAHTAGIPVSGRVTALNAGGLTVDLAGVRGFCPFSQIEAGFCADPSVYVGKTLEFLVTEVKDGRGGVVVSRKQLLRRKEKENAGKLLATIKIGDELEGTVARLEPFGAFVDLGGVDGLVHVSEIRHERTNHPKEALSPGEKVRVKVLRLEKGKDGRQKIALSIKAAQPDPWEGVESRYPRGARVKGQVVRLTDFGAFVNLEPGIDGLVHVSEAATMRVEHVKDVVTRGQEIEAVVLGVDPEKKRIALSIRQAMDPTLAMPEPAAERAGGGAGGGGGGGGEPRRWREGGERGPRGEREEMQGERGGRGGGGGRERGGRSDRGGRGERMERGGRGGRGGGGGRGGAGGRGEGRGRREEWDSSMMSRSTASNEPPPPTTMAIALREAMEKAKQKARDEGGDN
jgi:small subunit ribosomal protein S1